MSEFRYDLVVLHHTSDQKVEQLVQDILVVLKRSGDAHLEYKLSEALLFEQSNNAILENISQQQGEALQQKLRALKVATELRPTLQLVAKSQKNDDDLYVCPACGHEQLKSKAKIAGACDKCGVIGAKFEKQKKREAIYLAEKQRVEKQQANEVRKALNRARHDEEVQYREEARKRLGLAQNEKKPVNMAVGVLAVLLMGVAGFYITDSLMNSGGETSAEDQQLVEQKASQKGSGITLKMPQVNGGSIVLQNPDAPEGSVGQVVAGGEIAMTQGQSRFEINSAGSGDQVQVGSQILSNGSSDSENLQAMADGTSQANIAIQDSDSGQGGRVSGVSGRSGGSGIDVGQQALSSELANFRQVNSLYIPATMTLLDSSDYFSEDYKETPDLFEQQYQQVARLLELGRSDLAMVFIEEIEDPYAASLLMLETFEQAKAPSIDGSEQLLTLKRLAALTTPGSYQEALVSAHVALKHGIQQTDIAALMQDEMLSQVKNSFNDADQRLRLLMQVIQDQQRFGYHDGVQQLREKARQWMQQVPAHQQPMHSNMLLQMASGLASLGNFPEARDWLKKLPDPQVKQQAFQQLNQLEVQYTQKN